MTNTNLIERLNHLVSLDRPEKGGPYAGLAARECVSAMTEAAALIEQQEAVIASLSKALAEISAHETSEADNRNLNDLIAKESVRVARAAILAAKTHLDPGPP